MNEKIPRNAGNCRKCLVVNATSHANSLGLKARRFPLYFVTAPLWGARLIPPNQQLCNRPRCSASMVLRAISTLPGAFFIKGVSVMEVRLTFFFLLASPSCACPALNYRLSSPEGRTCNQIIFGCLSLSHLLLWRLAPGEPSIENCWIEPNASCV